MSTPPIATVIIPCGPKHIDLLPRAIRSARAQSVPVDVKWLIDTERKGPGYGRNRLAEQVETDFIVMLDADDYLHPQFVEKTLAAWKPGSYVYTDWWQNDRHVKAISCYGLYKLPDEATFHLPPTLFPTKIYHAIGGHDETLFGAEDTDYFYRANALNVHSIVIREPLFWYTDEGYRSKEAGADARWKSLIESVFRRYEKRMSMGCCGSVTSDKFVAPRGTHNEGDVLVRPTWLAVQRTFGRVSGRDYGKINRNMMVWIDPRDYNPKRFTEVKDWSESSPSEVVVGTTLAQARKALEAESIDPTDEASIDAAVRAAGLRVFGKKNIKHGFDIQQTPEELAAFIADAVERTGKKKLRVLEIGTGESAGLARFMVEVLGWEVVSVDVNRPETDLHDNENWTFVEAFSQGFDPAEHGEFDVVFIDGDHTFEAALADWEKYKDVAPIVAMHDIDLKGWWGDGSAKVWEQISKGPKGGLKRGFKEVIVEKSKQGLGWYVADA